MAFKIKKCLFVSSRFMAFAQTHCHKSISTFDGITVESVKKEFYNYEGGSVELKKNDETGIASITLCHEDKRNAISGRMMCQFNDIVADLEEWSGEGKGRAVLLKSNDKDFFCSGADLTSTVRNISRQVFMLCGLFRVKSFWLDHNLWFDFLKCFLLLFYINNTDPGACLERCLVW